MPNVSIIPSDEFRRQAKRLLKKHKTLLDDLTELQRLLSKDCLALKKVDTKVNEK